MEFNQENINKVVSVLKQKDLERAMKKVQDYSMIAEQLIKENPDLTVDEIGQLYDEQQNMLEQNNVKENENIEQTEESKEDNEERD